MIQPTIGRVVWYWPTVSEDDPPFAAMVAYVWDDTCINIGGFDANGGPFSNTSIQLIQGDEAPRGAHCRWMPYQKGQAAKTEALEQKLMGPGK
jgi:hypothetical protein